MFDHWKDFFHPHEGNDHHPHAYRRISVIALACVVGLVLVITAAQTGYIRNSDTFLSSVLPSVLVDHTNENRQSEGLRNLEPNDTLKQAAQLKANHMAENGYFAHDSPSGVTPWHWFAEAGYTYETAGENLAIDFSDSDAVVEAWMDSRLHRENILEEDFTEIGIATAEGEYKGRDTVFVVQMFGTPDERELAERERDEGGTDLAQTDEGKSSENTSSDTAGSTSTQTTSTEDLVAQLQNEVNEVQQKVINQQTVGRTQQQEQTDRASEIEGEAKSDRQQPTTTNANSDRLAQRPETNRQDTETDQENDQQSTTTAESVATTSETTELMPTEETATTSSTTDREDLPQDAFATPTPVGQVQGLSGISLLPADQASGFAHLISQPQLVYKLAFIGIAGLILLALLISIIVEAKHHHWKLAGYSLVTLVVLMAVFYVGSQLLFMEPAVAAAHHLLAG